MRNGILYNMSKRYASKWLVLFVDILLVVLSFFLAYLIRYNFRLSFDILVVLNQLPIVVLLAVLSFVLMGTHNGVVRYTGIRDILNIIIGVNVLATALIIVSFLNKKLLISEALNISGSIIYIHLLLNILSLIAFKFFVKYIYKKIIGGYSSNKNVLIYGAGDSGMITYEVISSEKQTNVNVVGFIDDNIKKQGKKINLAMVYSLDQLSNDLIENKKIDEIIISIQNIEPTRLLEITSTLFSLNLTIKIVPPVQNWIEGDLSIGQIKDVKIEDLLGRDPISITNPELEAEYNNEIIMITGAAGSIGSEICRKLTHFRFKKLILLDIAESGLYNLEQELKQIGKNYVNIIVGDVRDNERMEQIFDEFKPKIIFHAAAYKHVPLMENNPYEAVRVNICGTKNIANLSVKFGVKKFVLISTDKAVNPTNVMGATKRIAELYVNYLKGKGHTKFITTRFGNVLGSSGSVIPLFKKQIEIGGPVTVTHPEINRYFMTIPEACQLVLEAALMGNGNEIFVFDMGKPVQIFNLAKNMIRLSGLRYPEDIDIKITGLRPGEKIYEELLADGENTIPTYHEKILIARTRQLDVLNIDSKIKELCAISSKIQNIEIVALIKNILPEYKSNNSKFEVLDH